MDAVLQNKLYKKYPKLFAQHGLSMSETAMCWGIQCGNGWYHLIDKLCAWIYWNMEENPHIYPQIEFTTIKEKFGTLRIYWMIKRLTKKEYKRLKHTDWMPSYSEYCNKLGIWERIKIVWRTLRGWSYFKKFYGSESIEGAVSLAESMSASICEICGAPGKTKEIGKWWYTVCSKHEKEIIDGSKKDEKVGKP